MGATLDTMCGGGTERAPPPTISQAPEKVEAGNTKPSPQQQPQELVAATATDEQAKQVNKTLATTTIPYECVQTLGHGASCQVFKARPTSTTTTTTDSTTPYVALKRMLKSDKRNKRLYETEVHILQKLKHPNIVHLHDAHPTAADAFYIATGYCGGGELFDRVIKNSEAEKPFTERQASEMARAMVEALAHCHANLIVHRDLKPENFVFMDESESAELTLIDFGCAVESSDPKQVIRDVAGSVYYIAPETIDKNYKRTAEVWMKSDIWSVGVITFLLLHGYPPFNGSTQKAIFEKIRIGRYTISNDLYLSDEARDFISRCMEVNVMKRLSAQDALAHPWLNSQNVKETVLPPSVLAELGKFQAATLLKKAVANMMRRSMTPRDVDVVRAMFQKYDTNGDGRLDVKEIGELMKDMGQRVTVQSDEVEQWIQQWDVDGDGEINMDELLTARAASQLSVEEEAKREFEKMDVNKDRRLSVAEVGKMLGADADQVKAMFREADTDGDGEISYDEWLDAMRVVK